MIMHRDKIIQQQKSIFIYMMSCCKYDQNARHKAIDVLRQQPEQCRKHRKKIKFICHDCIEQSLLCSDCILDHQEHDWVSLATFLNDDVINLFQTGKSKSGIVVEEFVDIIVSNLVDFQKRIQDRLKKSLGLIMINLQKLKAKFPTDGGYQITGIRINQKNIKQINSILKNQKYVFDTTRIDKLYNEIIQVSQFNINQLLSKVQETLCNHEWDVLQQKQIAKIQRDFNSIYKKTPPLKKFYFSNVQKNRSIKVTNNKLTAVYENQLPKCPVILLDKFFTPQHSQVAFKVTKLQTHAFFFNLSIVYVGACNSNLADGFGYTDFAKPSKGAYLISSAGRCYHSKLPEYDDKRISFGFAAGDIICVDINFANRTVKFEKKTSKIPFGNVFQMPLSLQPSFVDQLKPCIMFSNELGAEITILNETELVLQLDGKQIFKVKNN